MTIVNPLATSNLVVQSTATTPLATAAERQVDLRLEQMVRATVVEGGLDRALLEMDHRLYRAQSDVELRAGQKLTLQVLQTHPTLEFRVVTDPLGDRLRQLLPLLGQAYDWSRLLENISQRPQPQGLPAATAQIYQQLQQLLQPVGNLPAALKTELQQLPVQLQQLAVALNTGQPIDASPLAVRPTSTFNYFPSGKPLPLDLPLLLRGVQTQLAQLQTAETQPLLQNWLAATRQLLQPLQQAALLTQGPLPLPALQPQLQELLGLLTQMRQQPHLPPQLSGELERLVLQLVMQSGREQPVIVRSTPPTAATPAPTPPSASSTAGQAAQTAAPATQTAAPTTQTAAPTAQTAAPTAQTAAPTAQTAAPTVQTAAPTAQTAAPATMTFQPLGVYRPPFAANQLPQPAPPPLPAEISSGLQQLLGEVQNAQQQSGKLAPELLGRLEGLLDKLQQLPTATQPAAQVLPGLEALSSQLMQMIQQGPQHPEGGKLGVLSQLFGFHLEAELLRGQKKEALASLKTSLLALQKEMGEEVKEPLRRLELFQLCKARLAEDQLQFLPLPFNELEEGYLLLENARQESSAGEEPPLHVTLSLRLSALGNMRVDLLYDQQGLHLQLACEDLQKMGYLQQHVDELKAAIETVPLRAVSFAADAQPPSRQLLERLLPEALGMLDARV